MVKVKVLEKRVSKVGEEERMHIHILGICGTFMGGVAALARQAGHKVTGCDANVYPPMSDQLKALGIELIEGYGAEQLAVKPDVYVVGNVVKRGMPLMEAILNEGLPYTSGPQWLAEHVLAGRHVLGVAGTHGKTSTASMLLWILEYAGMEPGFLIGGVPENFGVSARLGNVARRMGGTDSLGNVFVIEADEYDTAFFDKRSKFVHYRPRTVVLNNLEFDHADIFPDLAAIETQFHHLVRTVPGQGRIVVNGMQESLQRVMSKGCWSELAWFGLESSFCGDEVEPVWVCQGSAQDFVVYKQGQQVARVQWGLLGEHNQLNASAAIAAAEHVGVAPEVSAKALGEFKNVKRRMEVKGTVGGVTVYDDFAHHPTAIRTTIEGLRKKLDEQGREGDRIIAILEPRSNTMKLGTMSAQLPFALEAADEVYCYAPDLGWDVTGALSPLGSKAHVVRDVDELVREVVAVTKSGDQLLCMSNGGFGGVHGKLLEALKKVQM